MEQLSLDVQVSGAPEEGLINDAHSLFWVKKTRISVKLCSIGLVDVARIIQRHKKDRPKHHPTRLSQVTKKEGGIFPSLMFLFRSPSAKLRSAAQKKPFEKKTKKMKCWSSWESNPGFTQLPQPTVSNEQCPLRRWITKIETEG